MYPFVTLVTVLALILYTYTQIRVGSMRVKYKIYPPATEGPEEFIRVFRVQQNTVEALIAFLPALWIFGMYVSQGIAGIIGAIWLIGRLIYVVTYSRDASTRMPGFIIAQLATVVLVIGDLIAVLMRLFGV